MASNSNLTDYFSERELTKINQFNDEGKNLLHIALEDDEIPSWVVAELIELGADVNLVTGSNRKEQGLYDFDLFFPNVDPYKQNPIP